MMAERQDLSKADAATRETAAKESAAKDLVDAEAVSPLEGARSLADAVAPRVAAEPVESQSVGVVPVEAPSVGVAPVEALAVVDPLLDEAARELGALSDTLSPAEVRDAANAAKAMNAENSREAQDQARQAQESAEAEALIDLEAVVVEAPSVGVAPVEALAVVDPLLDEAHGELKASSDTLSPAQAQDAENSREAQDRARQAQESDEAGYEVDPAALIDLEAVDAPYDNAGARIASDVDRVPRTDPATTIEQASTTDASLPNDASGFGSGAEKTASERSGTENAFEFGAGRAFPPDVPPNQAGIDSSDEDDGGIGIDISLDPDDGTIDLNSNDLDGEYSVVGTVDKVPDGQASETPADDALPEE
jgi:hypothetical protein